MEGAAAAGDGHRLHAPRGSQARPIVTGEGASMATGESPAAYRLAGWQRLKA